MKIDTKLARSFNQAVTSSANRLENGEVNWNFVDADVYMDLAEIKNVPDNYLEQFEYLGGCYTGEISLADRIAEANELAA